MSGSGAIGNSTRDQSSYLTAPLAKIVNIVDDLGFVSFGFERELSHLGRMMGFLTRRVLITRWLELYFCGLITIQGTSDQNLWIDPHQQCKPAILSIPPLIPAGIRGFRLESRNSAEFQEFRRIPAGIDRNPTGINTEHPYLGYILRFYFRYIFWNRGIDQNSIIFKNLT